MENALLGIFSIVWHPIKFEYAIANIPCQILTQPWTQGKRKNGERGKIREINNLNVSTMHYRRRIYRQNKDDFRFQF